MPTLRITFDRGTLRLDGAVAALGDDRVVYDPRTGFHRAAAHRHAAIVEAARARGLHVRDEVAPRVQPVRETLLTPPLRPYQEQALAAFETFGRRGVIVLPTGSGKTHVALAAIARARASALVLVPTRALLHQWREALARIHPGPIGAIGDGEDRVEPITVMTFESAFRRLDRHGDRFGMLVVDEVHHFGGVRSEALEMCTAPVRLGLTATPQPPGSDADAAIRALIGPVVCALGIRDLVGKHLADLDVVRLSVVLEPDERQRYLRDSIEFGELRREFLRANPGADWETCLKAIARLPGGRAAIAAMHRATALAAFPRGKRRLVTELVRRHWAERSLIFTASTADAYAIGRDLLVPVITAETSKPEREWILAAFRRGDVRAIANARVLNEGIDVPDASVAIVAGGALGRREHAQRIGRILRPAPGKRAIAYELVTLDTVDEPRTRARSRALEGTHAPDHAPLVRHP